MVFASKIFTNIGPSFQVIIPADLIPVTLLPPTPGWTAALEDSINGAILGLRLAARS